MPPIEAVRWSDDGHAVRILAQRARPAREEYRDLRTVDDVCEAIRTLAVRGAPAIGIAGAMGLTLVAARGMEAVEQAASRIRATRPTAVNLPWALDRMLSRARAVNGDADALRDEATRILDEDRAMCRRIGECGATLLSNPARVLTH